MNAVSNADIAADERIAPNISVFMGFPPFRYKFFSAMWKDFTESVALCEYIISLNLEIFKGFA